MSITYKKAPSIRAWDVYVGNQFIERFSRKKDAVDFISEMEGKYGVVLSQ